MSIIGKDNQIEVTGSKVKCQGTDVLLIRKLRRTEGSWHCANAQEWPTGGGGCW